MENNLFKITKDLRSDLFYQISSKYGSEKACNYPSIKACDDFIIDKSQKDEDMLESHNIKSFAKSLYEKQYLYFYEKLQIGRNIDDNDLLVELGLYTAIEIAEKLENISFRDRVLGRLNFSKQNGITTLTY